MGQKRVIHSTEGLLFFGPLLAVGCAKGCRWSLVRGPCPQHKSQACCLGLVPASWFILGRGSSPERYLASRSAAACLAAAAAAEPAGAATLATGPAADRAAALAASSSERSLAIVSSCAASLCGRGEGAVGQAFEPSVSSACGLPARGSSRLLASRGGRGRYAA